MCDHCFNHWYSFYLRRLSNKKYLGEVCYIANVGDSKAIMSCEKGTKIQVLNREHKPSDQEEKERILSYGGKLYRYLKTFSSINFFPYLQHKYHIV